MKTVRVASYNIRKAIGTDRRRVPERVIDVLNELDADIIALQEADRRFGVRSAALPHWLVESISPYKPVPLNVHVDSMGWHGNAILVRKEAEVGTHDVLHLPCLEPRGATMAEVRLGQASLRIFGMHLDLSGLWRRKQAAAVIHAAGLGDPMPTVLMGDLNEWRLGDRSALNTLATVFGLPPAVPSFPSRLPVLALDRIMANRPGLIERVVTHDTPLARLASDHLPIKTVVKLGSTAEG